MTLSATVLRNTLVVSGLAAGVTGQVRIVADGSNSHIDDDTFLVTKIPISGDLAAIASVDVRGLTGSGAFISVLGDAPSVITGTGGDDIIRTGSGPNIVRAGDGFDAVTGNGHRDWLSGGAGDDFLGGGGGDDTLTGGHGNDTLDGGAGFDTAIYAANRADYTIAIRDGQFVVTDLRQDGRDGEDVLHSVEQLSFTDQVETLPEAPTLLTARIDGFKLVVDGAASGALGLVIIEASGEFTSVLDDSTVGVLVPIEGQSQVIRNVDARSVTTSGVYVTMDNRLSSQITGTSQNDIIFGGHGNNIIRTSWGDDFLTGGQNKDYLSGGPGNDTISGLAGDDTLIGYWGNDTIDGGDGLDVAVFQGSLNDYALTAFEHIIEVTDLRTGRNDGVDLITNVEQFRFADQTLNVLEDWIF